MLQPKNLSNSVLGLPVKAMVHYKDHCYDFVCDQILRPVWDKMRPTRQQKEAMDAISKYERVGIDSGHGTGKSSLFSWVGIWFLDTRPSPCRVPCTAPTGHQLKDVLWSNFSMWLGTAVIADDLEWMATEIRHKILAHPHFAIARTSNKSENMQGQHQLHMLWLIDECYGITITKIFDVIEGSMTQPPDNRMLMGGQPTQVTGYCADAKNPKKSPQWTPPKGVCLRFDAEKSEIVQKSWVDGMAKKYGTHSDIYRMRVKGLPPLGNPKAFISLALVMLAVNNEVELNEEGQLPGVIELGLDPAREGDDLCVLASRKGNYFFPNERYPKTDELEMAAIVLNRVRNLRQGYFIDDKYVAHPYTGRIRVKIGVTGGYGGGCLDILRRNRTDNIEVLPVVEGGAGSDLYANSSTVMYGDLRDNIRQIKLQDDDDVIGQLSTREVEIDLKTGKEILESKKAYKKRMSGTAKADQGNQPGLSPNDADAIVFCWSTKGARALMVSVNFGSCVTRLNVRWDRLFTTTQPYVGLWMNKLNQVGCVVSIWKPQVKKLFVVYSHTYETPYPGEIVPNLKAVLEKLSSGHVKSINRFTFYGNDAFKDISVGSVQDAWMRYDVTIQVIDKFDVDGAAVTLDRMLKRKVIIFDEIYGAQVAVEIQGWFVDKKDEARPCVYALANIAARIWDGPMKEPDPKDRVGREAREIEKRMKFHPKAKEMALRDKGINLPTPHTSTGWMV